MWYPQLLHHQHQATAFWNENYPQVDVREPSHPHVGPHPTSQGSENHITIFGTGSPVVHRAPAQPTNVTVDSNIPKWDGIAEGWSFYITNSSLRHGLSPPPSVELLTLPRPTLWMHTLAKSSTRSWWTCVLPTKVLGPFINDSKFSHYGFEMWHKIETTQSPDGPLATCTSFRKLFHLKQDTSESWSWGGLHGQGSRSASSTLSFVESQSPTSSSSLPSLRLMRSTTATLRPIPPCGDTTILNSDLFVFSQMGYAINTHSNVTSSFGGTHTPIRNKATELANGCGGGSGGGAGAGRCANGCSGAGVGNYSTARLTPRVKYRGNLIFVNCAKSVRNAPDASATTIQNETQQISGWPSLTEDTSLCTIRIPPKSLPKSGMRNILLNDTVGVEVEEVVDMVDAV